MPRPTLGEIIVCLIKTDGGHNYPACIKAAQIRGGRYVYTWYFYGPGIRMRDTDPFAESVNYSSHLQWSYTVPDLPEHSTLHPR